MENYALLEAEGLSGLAWEFLRRCLSFRMKSRAVAKGKEDAKNVCLEYGLKELKDWREPCFEGRRPQFNVVRLRRYRFDKNGLDGAYQRRSVRLAPGQVAVVFDLTLPLKPQQTVATSALRRQQVAWRKADLISSSRERLATDSIEIARLITMLRAIDAKKQGQSYSEIGRHLFPSVVATKQKQRAQDLHATALGLVTGGYMLIALRGQVVMGQKGASKADH